MSPHFQSFGHARLRITIPLRIAQNTIPDGKRTARPTEKAAANQAILDGGAP